MGAREMALSRHGQIPVPRFGISTPLTPQNDVCPTRAWCTSNGRGSSGQRTDFCFYRPSPAPRSASADLFDAFNHSNLGNPSITIADRRDGGSAVPAASLIYRGSEILALDTRLEM